ncbi:MAG: preprotein translocase subunit SecE [Candidatus Margulisbacteria bacterium]|nr:preprotein translocase subunit SecE [Candidatus Margulisiibacteriota bacterium]MBU1021041.1 preprotein translocase subunit SecE [Candidatus Margulisiibacteriota bacterium]MBU1729716.1 preprotein translocase subunit SecE [Candidatus Margulisiibacteriota bacterium]MBU1955981.1 preprotein translocase subunit SecE [Candidatus Margulisiibacteriota bacterium]
MPGENNKVVKAGSKIGRFFKETRAEVKKVVWPDRRYVMVATIVILAIVILVSVFVMFVDWGFSNIFKTLRTIF